MNQQKRDYDVFPGQVNSWEVQYRNKITKILKGQKAFRQSKAMRV